jgi:heparan-alpha-glucosaminide N-acetyltransferase
MIFVDNLGFVAGLPWWTNHMPRDVNGMTYVDMVFPAFLFLMGMAIPLSLDSRLCRGDSSAKLWAHIFLRSGALVALGLFVANSPQVDAKHTGISQTVWTALGFLSIALAWSNYPKRANKKLVSGLKAAGLVLFLVLMAVFRRVTAEGHIACFDFSDWEILGLLGWAYLLCCTLYFVFRRKLLPLLIAFVVLVGVNALSVARHLAWMTSWPPIAKPFEAGLSSITLAGVLAALVFAKNKVASTFHEKSRWAILSALFLFATGWLLRPLGISKIRDTPTWCLYCIAANILIVWLLYWVADKNGSSRWAWFAKPIGANALLAYFLPYTAYLISFLWPLTAGDTSGWYGVFRALLFTAGAWLTVMLLAKWNYRLRV